MTALRRSTACAGALLGVLALTTAAPAVLTAPAAPQIVQQCQDPGRSWCGGDTFSIERYAPDGHYRDDGSIPLAEQETMR